MSRVAALLLVLLPALPGGAAAQSARSVTFDQYRPGTAPGVFACETAGPGLPGRWAVTQALAEGGVRRVFAQTSQAGPPDRVPHCLLRGYRAADVDIVALVKPVSGDIAQAGGIVFRAVDHQNFYALMADAKARTVGVWRIERGRRFGLPLAGEERKYVYRLTLERERWYQLRVRATGSRFEVFVDSRKLFEVEDDAYPDAGFVGLATGADSVVQFDAFSASRAR